MVKGNIGFIIILLVLLVTQGALATSIQKIGMQDLASQAELVFEGEVIASDARWNEAQTRIYTYVTFRVDEVIKGSLSTSALELRFSGGTVADQTLEYQGMIYPIVGERGIYFVESLQRPQVNPLLGWSQGHYTLDNDTVENAEGRPVIGVETGFRKTVGEISEGTPGGVKLGTAKSQGMNKAEFKSLIKLMSEEKAPK